ncbi:hypothetical protein FOA52_010959 [Chlamydomonas sp. UWO 241]|nr:hypothetical protein FOA52_010959 [Chlamydomonas sp. UWO 241]
MEDENLKPLRVALELAGKQAQEATNLREALEAEAQEVAQLAVEACQSLKSAKAMLGYASDVENEDLKVTLEPEAEIKYRAAKERALRAAQPGQ